MQNPEILKIDEIFKELKTSEKGLSINEANKRLQIYGKNVLEEEKLNKFKLFITQFQNILVYVLLAASIISIISHRLVDFFTIILLVLLNGFIGYFQELKAHVSIKALRKLTETKETVIRDNKETPISSKDLVPGDIISIEEGDIIAADIRLIKTVSLETDESSLTGESLPVIKHEKPLLKKDSLIFDQKNMLFSGTTVVKGSGLGVVINTAKKTYLSTIAEKIKEKAPESPLSRAIKHFAKRYTFVLMILLAIIGVIGFFQGRGLLMIAYILIAELVSAVPEGLPIVVTLVMVIGAKYLSKKKTFIRHLPAVETLGSATVIATDKTGTITKGELTVSKVFSLDENLTKIAVSLCNDAKHDRSDPIDIALKKWVPNFEELREKHLRVWTHPFDTKKRLMATVNKFENGEKIFVKGAYESLQQIATNQKDFKEFEKSLHEMTSKGLRVLAIGVGNYNSKNDDDWKIKIIALIGFLDPPKDGVKEAVVHAKNAGIKVIMITGDHPKTAKSIAEDVNIFEDGNTMLTGLEIDKMTDDNLIKELKTATVLARILPDHKYRIVKLLQSQKEIVAVSGDGINDISALKAADLSIAMGNGSEAAIAVSKMVIGNNNLKIIITAIRNGRIIADNVRKVIYYLLSSSLQEIFLISFAIISNLPLPLLPLQILWINLVTDGVQDKTFAFAKEEGNVMKRLPKKPISQFFDLSQIINILIFGIVMGVFSFELFKYLLNHYSYHMAVTITFTSVVSLQWFNGIQAQKENEPFFKNIKASFTINPYIFIGVFAGILFQLFAIYIACNVFQTEPMPLKVWIFPIMGCIIGFSVVEIRKWLFLLINYKKGKKII